LVDCGVARDLVLERLELAWFMAAPRCRKTYQSGENVAI